MFKVYRIWYQMKGKEISNMKGVIHLAKLLYKFCMVDVWNYQISSDKMSLHNGGIWQCMAWWNRPKHLLPCITLFVVVFYLKYTYKLTYKYTLHTLHTNNTGTGKTFYHGVTVICLSVSVLAVLFITAFGWFWSDWILLFNYLWY